MKSMAGRLLLVSALTVAFASFQNCGSAGQGANSTKSASTALSEKSTKVTLHLVFADPIPAAYVVEAAMIAPADDADQAFKVYWEAPNGVSPSITDLPSPISFSIPKNENHEAVVLIQGRDNTGLPVKFVGSRVLNYNTTSADVYIALKKE